MRIQADYFKVSSTLPTEIARRKAWIPRMKGDLQDTKRQVHDLFHLDILMVLPMSLNGWILKQDPNK